MNTTRSITKKATRLAVALSFFLIAFPGAAQEAEPSVALARQWWPEQTNVWTPFGWPDHYFKFNVLYNGGLILATVLTVIMMGLIFSCYVFKKKMA